MHGTMGVNALNHLEIGGCDASELAAEYGTPLYVMDEALMTAQCALFKNAFQSEGVTTEVAYASKAFLTLEMCRFIDAQGLSLDVVSGGELFTAMKAKFPADRIYFHGNNKSMDELTMAVEHSVGTIIVDHAYEVVQLERVCEVKGQRVNVLLRINPGIAAHTHEYIQTANPDSKFGMFKDTQETLNLIQKLMDSHWLNLKGLHYHIGSQISETDSFLKGADVMCTYLTDLQKRIGFTAEVLNMGGGFGVYYTEEDATPDLAAFLPVFAKSVAAHLQKANYTCPKLVIEPGRSIVANAGTTLYTIGAVKQTAGGKTYVFIDGGMTDNPRPALYEAVYEAALANRMEDAVTQVYAVGGKCCESGDILIHSVELPSPVAGDLLAVSVTGAYNYSMASQYNRNCKPAVVWVKAGGSRLVVKRESYEDLIRNDI